MYDILKDKDIVITNNKDNILNYLYDNKKLLDIKIMTKKEFIDEYFGYYDEKAIYYMCTKYKYSIAKTYLDNFLFNEKLKNELEEKNLIIHNDTFKSRIERIILDDVELDPYIIKELKKYEIKKLEEKNEIYSKVVYEADNIDEEVNFVILNIISLLKDVNIDKIHLLNVGKEYILPIKRLFSFYNIPININDKKTVYTEPKIQEFIKKLKETNNIEISLDIIKDNELYTPILNICNKFSFKETDKIIINLIEEKIKELKIEKPKIKNAVDITNKIINDDYYFILGFNQGEFVRTYRDDDFLSDAQKTKYGVFTSFDKNRIEREKIKKIITQNKNIIISYKTNYLGDECYPSRLISECDFEIKKVDIKDYTHSNMYNKVELALKLDKYIKFNIEDEDINTLYNNYNIPYKVYNNAYTPIDKDEFYKFINNRIVLSYTTLNEYNKCGFKYYLDNIIKVDGKEDTLSLFIGNICHYVLSKSFEEGFDFEKEFTEYSKNREWNNEEQIFLEMTKEKLKKAVEIIQKQDKNINLNEVITEQKKYIEHKKKIDFLFTGTIDKIRYSIDNNETTAMIVDYKTGKLKDKINLLPYGINNQLPTYLYLLRHFDFKNLKTAGFYLQSIIPPKNKYEYKKDNKVEFEKNYNLVGFTNKDVDIEKYNLDTKKILTEKQIDKIYKMVEKNIDESEQKIENVEFNINPKKQGSDEISCEYCNYKDICYRKYEDYKYLLKQDYKQFLGGDDDEVH